jgi:hypothetical protein
LPLLAVIALVFIYMVTKGETPTLALLGEIPDGSYMSANNLFREAIIIGGFTWGLIWLLSTSLLVFARDEASGLLSMFEPIRGLIPSGIMSVFFGMLASLTKGQVWIYVGLALLALCTLGALIISLKKLPLLSALNDRDVPKLPSGKWVAGLFYVCKEDPRILVPRQRGAGTTLNLAHGRAWGILITGIVVVALAIIASFGGII